MFERRITIKKNKELEIDFRCDLFIENCLVVELKSVLQLYPIIEAQVQTYMKLLKAPKGIILKICQKIKPLWLK